MSSKPLTIITDRKPEKWEAFLLSAIERTQAAVDEGNTELTGMYYAAPMRDGRILAGYESLDPTDLCVVAASAMMDAIDLFLEQNFEDYYNRMQNGELNPEGDDDAGGVEEC